MWVLYFVFSANSESLIWWNFCRVDYELKAVEGEAKLVICEAEKRLTADFLVVGNHAYGKINRCYFEP